MLPNCIFLKNMLPIFNSNKSFKTINTGYLGVETARSLSTFLCRVNFAQSECIIFIIF